jgi:sugar phosphate isomerase/epimerase
VSDLEQAYRGTSYMIDAPGAPLAIRVDERSAELDALLAKFGARFWAFITAYNPYSEPRSADENLERHRRLLDAVRERGLQSFPSHGVDDDGTWPIERGLLVLDIDRDDAVALGRELEQNAILVGEAGVAAELVFCFEERK